MNPAVLLLPIVLTGAPVAPNNMVAASTSQTAPVALGAEAWYSSPQLCLIPQLCLPIPSPVAQTYPAGTLHIGAAVGQESARTYLALHRNTVTGRIIKGGTLRLPLDIDPVDGSLAPDLAKVEACTTTAPIKEVSGSTAKPPAVNCVGAPVSRIIGTPATELDIDLRPLASRLSKPGTGVALLPVLTSGATWDVTVSSDRRAKSSATTPVLILTTVSRAAYPTSPSVAPTAGYAGGGTSMPSQPIPVDPSLGDLGPQTAPVPAAGAIPPVIAPATSPAAARFSVARHGFDYPVVFLVPLLILAGLLGLGQQLTKPLTRRASGIVD